MFTSNAYIIVHIRKTNYGEKELTVTIKMKEKLKFDNNWITVLEVDFESIIYLLNIENENSKSESDFQTKSLMSFSSSFIF